MSDPPPRWDEWAARRPTPQLVHLDNGAAGRSSLATLEATAAHARLEAELGSYVAQARALPVLDGLRRDVAGLLGVEPDGVAFVESASTALATLLSIWPIRDGGTVAVVPAEWGPNHEAFARRGLDTVDVDVDERGRADLEALAKLLADDPPVAVHLTQVTSHRGLVQPVAEAAAVCRDAGVPLWVDAAQAIGHVDTATGADAVYATSRKWLTGPRGVGMLAVATAWWDELAVPRSALAPAGLTPVALMESHEAHVAGRVGLASAVREYLTDGPAQIHRRLDEVGAQVRAAIADVPGWEVVGVDEPSGAITAIRPTRGQDVAATASRLLDEHRVLTTPCEPARAPHELTGPVLRISPHVDLTGDDLTRLCAGLSGNGLRNS